MAEIVTMPKLGFDMAEGTLVRWMIAEGEMVAKGKVLAEIETDKATVEVESAHDGVLVRHLVKQGDIVPVNTPIAVVGQPGEAVNFKALGLDIGEGAAPAPAATPAADRSTPAAQPAAAPDAAPAAQDHSEFPGGVKASPVARKMAAELGIDLSQVTGSGPGGRVIKQDLENYTAPAAPAEKPAAAPATQPGPVTQPRADEHVGLSRLRQAIARRMVEAKQQIPHFYVTHEYNMAPLTNLRKQVNALLPEAEKASVNDFIIKAVALTLRSFPKLNASLNEAKGEIIQHGQINIGVAVAVEQGLLTVVCRDADAKPLRQIGEEVRNLAGKARLGKVRPDDIEGSTFSISNLGMFDVEHFIAIINPPEAAILAVGSAREVPVVENGEIKPGLRMKATISVDHRVSDGAEAARFLVELARYIEEPMRLML